MDDPEISLIHIATPNATHYPLGKRALEAEKHVLIEKPMTLNSHEAYELVDLAAEKGLVVEVGHLFRFNEALRVARKMITAGEVGKLYYVRIQWTDLEYFEDRDIIFDLGPHPVDILNQLLSTWPKEVSGVAKAYRTSQYEVAYISAEYPDDIFAHIELSWLYPSKVREASIVGSEGSLIVDCLDQTIVRHYPKESFEIPVIPSNTIAGEIDHFVDRVENGKLNIDVTGPKTVETLERITASIRERETPETIARLARREQIRLQHASNPVGEPTVKLPRR